MTAISKKLLTKFEEAVAESSQASWLAEESEGTDRYEEHAAKEQDATARLSLARIALVKRIEDLEASNKKLRAVTYGRNIRKAKRS